MIQSTKKIDTLALIDFDSGDSKIENIKQVVLVTESKGDKTKAWYEASVLVSFVYPMLTAIVIILASRFFDRRKNKKALKKSDKEIEKLKVETENIKRSFQPIVISTLQATQDKLLDKKIEALEKLNHLRKVFITYPEQYFEGEIRIPHVSEYPDLIFQNYNVTHSNDFESFHKTFAYIFSDNLLSLLNQLERDLNDFSQHIFNFNDATEGDYSRITNNDRELVNKLVQLYDEAIRLLRQDCHINTDYIHQFIEDNK